jgi:AraC family transcriptional regulator, transcriptional activator of pobA
MNLLFKDNRTSAEFHLIFNESSFNRLFYVRDRKDKLLTIVWNCGRDQKINLDGVEYIFPAKAFLPLMINQSFHFERTKDIVAWQFNRDFYCILNHDQEVSCVGFIFYGSFQPMFIILTESEQIKIGALLQVFKDEFNTTDNIQGEMLRMLLVRLIITITRLAKYQFASTQSKDANDKKFYLFRQFNLMVENNYRIQHEVKFYALELSKSPKTLANTFAIYGQKTPLQVIQERIVLEAKRLFYYTNKSAKEIASELGFEDASHFSRFFKNQTGQSPTEFKSSIKKSS